MEKKKVYKWIIKFDTDTRIANIECPKCHTLYRYNILNNHSFCPNCKIDLFGLYDPNLEKRKGK